MLDINLIKSENDVIYKNINNKYYVLYVPYVLFSKLGYAHDDINAKYFFKADTKKECENWVNKILLGDRSMAVEVTTKVVQVNTDGPKLNKQGKEFYIHKIQGHDGNTYERITNNDEFDVNVGDTLDLVVQSETNKWGTKNKIMTMNKSGGADTSDVPFKVKTVKVVSTKQENLNVTVSKDTSMEVSGILQALLSTGEYNKPNAEGKTFIEEKMLENHLTRALKLKRKVAQDLENGTL